MGKKEKYGWKNTVHWKNFFTILVPLKISDFIINSLYVRIQKRKTKEYLDGNEVVRNKVRKKLKMKEDKHKLKTEN